MEYLKTLATFCTAGSIFLTLTEAATCGLGSVSMTLSLSARSQYSEGSDGSSTIYGVPINDDSVVAGDIFTIATAPISFNHSSDQGEGFVFVSGVAGAVLQLDDNRQPSGKIVFSGSITANATPNSSPGWENVTAGLRMEIQQSWRFLDTYDGVYTVYDGNESVSRFNERKNWLAWPEVHATNFGTMSETKSESFVLRQIWRTGSSTYPGQSKDNPLGSESGGNRPSDNTVTTNLKKNDEPPFAQLPSDISGINLTAQRTARLAAASTLTESDESTFAMSLYGSPVLTGGYGDVNAIYHRTTETSGTVALVQSEGAQISTVTSPVYTTGYLFMNNGGGNFTSFTIPDALPGGDSQFRINLNGEGYDLAAGQVFEFTTIDSAGVDSFMLVDIDESEMISPEAGAPFVFGVTNASDSDASFAVVPLVPIQVPEPGTLAVVLFGILGTLFYSGRRLCHSDESPKKSVRALPASGNL